MRNNYVYVYSVEGKPIYVGIGTDDDGSYRRARNLEGHSEVRRVKGSIDIEIIASKVSRVTARTLELTLIRQYNKTYQLLNKIKNGDKQGNAVLAQWKIDPFESKLEKIRVRSETDQFYEAVRKEYFKTSTCRGAAVYLYTRAFYVVAADRDFLPGEVIADDIANFLICDEYLLSREDVSRDEDAKWYKTITRGYTSPKQRSKVLQKRKALKLAAEISDIRTKVWDVGFRNVNRFEGHCFPCKRYQRPKSVARFL